MWPVLQNDLGQAVLERRFRLDKAMRDVKGAYGA